MKFLKQALFSMIFVSNLTIGSQGEDVARLQQFLVSENYLEMPAGVSYGYFGPLTKAGVAKWQAQSGVSPAVGFFGPISRATIASQPTTNNQQPTTQTTPITPSPPPETDTPHALGMRANRIMLFRAFPYEVRVGDEITLDGSSFSKTRNEIYFNNGNVLTATSTNGTILKFLVPNLSEGEYTLSVTNVLGSSDQNIKVSIKVTNNPHPGPMITSASISGDTVTILGSGFTSSNNLYTTFGNSSSPVSSSGNTLTFQITDLSLYNQIKDAISGSNYTAVLLIYVQNEHGTSKDPSKLEIVI